LGYLAASAAGLAAQPDARIEGELVDQSGAPLPGAMIVVRTTTDARVVVSLNTTLEGRFAVTGLVLGDYVVEATLEGFASVAERVTVIPDQVARVRLVASLARLAAQVTVRAGRTGETSSLDTPLAVTPLDSRGLDDMAARTPQDLTGVVPSLMVAETVGYAQPALRGIGTTAIFAGSDPSVATYVDGVYMSRPTAALGELVDVERVEVVRGPQGALYGRNALAGLIHVYTKEPGNQLETSGRVAAGADGLFHAAARAGGALVADRLMGSIAVSRDTRSGDVNDLDHPGEPLGGRDSFSTLGKLRAVMGPRADLLFAADVTSRDPRPLSYNKVLAAKPGVVLDNPAGFWDVRTSDAARSRQRQGGASLRARWQASAAVNVQSLTAARWVDHEVEFDSDFSERSLLVTRSRQRDRQVSEELTAMGHAQRMTWMAGLLLFDERDEQPTTIEALAQGVDTRLAPDARTSATAAFGHASFLVGRGVTLTGGLRRSVERKRITNAIGAYRSGDAAVIPGSAFAYDTRKTMGAWMPVLGFEVRTRHVGLVHVTASRGFKSGGYKPTGRDPGEGYAAERAASIEAGVKRRLPGDRGALQARAYLTDYRDLQVQTTVRQGVLDIRNAADAKIHGVELDGTLAVAGGLRVDGSVAWLDARYDKYAALAPDGGLVDVAGHYLNRAPPWSARLAATWSRAAGQAGRVSLYGEVQATDRFYFTPLNDALQSQGAFGMLHARATFESRSGRWAISLFGRNLTNERTLIATASSSPVAISGHPGEARSMGLEFHVQTVNR
jgi:iron complex outermembrane receptor protein